MVTYKKAAIYSKIGHPPNVIEFVDVEKPTYKNNEVVIDVEIATINPSHLLALSGKYGVHKSLPAVGGGEGVGCIAEIGSSVTGFKIGDRVISSGLGGLYPKGILIGWVSEIRHEQHELFKTAILESAVDFNSIEEVFVIIPSKSNSDAVAD